MCIICQLFIKNIVQNIVCVKGEIYLSFNSEVILKAAPHRSGCKKLALLLCTDRNGIAAEIAAACAFFIAC